MRIVKWIAIGIIGLLVVLVIVAFILPRHAVVSRSVDIAAPAASIYPLIGDLRRFNEWSPWFMRDPAATYTFTGPTDGVGQTMNWVSEKDDVGSGSMRIERLEQDKSVDMAIAFVGEGDALATLTLTPKGEATTVVWGFDTDLGFNPVARYFGMMMDGMVGPDYEAGLAKLKKVVETPPPPPRARADAPLPRRA